MFYTSLPCQFEVHNMQAQWYASTSEMIDIYDDDDAPVIFFFTQRGNSPIVQIEIDAQELLIKRKNDNLMFNYKNDPMGETIGRHDAIKVFCIDIDPTIFWKGLVDKVKGRIKLNVLKKESDDVLLRHALEFNLIRILEIIYSDSNRNENLLQFDGVHQVFEHNNVKIKRLENYYTTMKKHPEYPMPSDLHPIFT